MKKEEVQKMINEAISSLRTEMDSFKKWRKYASVIDKFSPITGASNQIGFYGTTKVAKQTVTGSRGSNAALASLLTALSNIGLITDSSS